MLNVLPGSRWNLESAAHLLSRAGFGGTPADIARLHARGFDGAVSFLVNYDQVDDPTPAPEWAKPDPERQARLREAMALRRKLKQGTDAERKEAEEKGRELLREQMRAQGQHLVQLRHWWLQRMLTGPRPLQEKLTLFWHGHFATSMQKVKDVYLMWLQNETFRRNASGNWLTMLTEVTKDPAMLIWLDQTQSRKAHPNENYAREVMELFTLGEGHYTEKDVTEAARAFTGLVYDRLNEQSTYRPFIHDTGTKTVLGKTGALTYSDVLEQIVAQPQAALFITSKLWNYFAGQPPSAELARALAAVFERNGRNFKAVLTAMFRSDEFYDPAIVRNQVKSPVQWLVGSLRMLERELPPPIFASNLLQNLGQDLFAPPNVKGWDGGVSWITTNNLLARYNYAEMLVFGTAKVSFNGKAAGNKGLKMLENRFNRMNTKGSPADVEKLLTAADRGDKANLLSALESRFLHGKLKPRQEQALREYLDARPELDQHDILEAIRLVMSTPEYQVT